MTPLNVRVELALCEETLLEEIADPKMKRRDVAMTYGLAIRSSEAHQIDWGKVNQAIIKRWSLSALDWIKAQAWKPFGPLRYLSSQRVSGVRLKMGI